MKRINILLSAVLLVLVTSNAFADGKHHRWQHSSWNNYQNHGNYVGHRGWNGYNWNTYNGWVDRGWNNRRSHNRRRHNGGTFISLNFGSSLFNSRRHDYRYRESARVVSQTSRYIRPSRVSQSSRTYSTTRRQSERSLVKDINGNCYERSYDADGTELRVELDPASCQF